MKKLKDKIILDDKLNKQKIINNKKHNSNKGNNKDFSNKKDINKDKNNNKETNSKILNLDKIDLTKGHRQRLRNKFMISKNMLEDYELLEMLLFYVFTRKDTKPLAKLLLLKFNNNLHDIINADENQLKEIEGIGDGVINLFKLIQEINNRILKKDIKLKNNINNINTTTNKNNSNNNNNKKHKEITALNNIDSVKNYCRNKIGNLIKEQVLVLFLNNKCELITDEVINVGNANETKVYNSVIVNKATNNASSKIVLVHNHPSGDATPSVNDILLTKDLKDLLLNFGITLLEHIVVSRNNAVGIMESGMLE